MMMDDVDEYWRRVFEFSPFTVWFNLTGQPGMMLPLGQSTGGLPLAVQLVGRFGDEGTLFRLGSQLEVARPWYRTEAGVGDFVATGTTGRLPGFRRQQSRRLVRSTLADMSDMTYPRSKWLYPTSHSFGYMARIAAGVLLRRLQRGEK
ncbi:MAG: hypothetical protein WDZ63_17480 [Burkholderiales bacterium]